MLLDDNLRALLLECSREPEDEPIVYAKFHLPGTTRCWYVTEGEPRGNDYAFFGFVTPANEFRAFWLSELEETRGLFGAKVERDTTFVPGPLTDVVPAPDN